MFAICSVALISWSCLWNLREEDHVGDSRLCFRASINHSSCIQHCLNMIRNSFFFYGLWPCFRDSRSHEICLDMVPTLFESHLKFFSSDIILSGVAETFERSLESWIWFRHASENPKRHFPKKCWSPIIFPA